MNKQNLQSWLIGGAGGVLLIAGGVVIGNADFSTAVPVTIAPPPAEVLLEARPPNMDFKSACAGTTLKLEFRIQNQNAAPVTVDAVVPSCGCTTVDFSQKELAPGESLPVRIEVKTPSKKHEDFRKAVTVLFRKSGEDSYPRRLKVGILGSVKECN